MTQFHRGKFHRANNKKSLLNYPEKQLIFFFSPACFWLFVWSHDPAAAPDWLICSFYPHRRSGTTLDPLFQMLIWMSAGASSPHTHTSVCLLMSLLIQAERDAWWDKATIFVSLLSFAFLPSVHVFFNVGYKWKFYCFSCIVKVSIKKGASLHLLLV